MRALEDRYRKPVDADSHKYYEVAQCSECNTTEDLLVHRYNDDIMCTHCLNEQVDRIKHEEDVAEEERQSRSPSLRGDSEALTLYERNK